MHVLERKRITLAASIACCDLYNLASQIPQLEEAGVSLLHFDVVDGKFNDCIILGTPTIAAIRPHTALPIEVHLAVYEPEKYIDQFVAAGADYVAVHYEVLAQPWSAFSQIEQAGARPILALRAETDVDENLVRLLPGVDWVVKLTVNPGYPGQSMRPGVIDKIVDLRAAARGVGLNVGIEADGNVNVATIPLVVRAGADILTGGTSGLFVPGKTIGEAAQDMRLVALNAIPEVL